ncbi:hypothetical protein C0J52_15942 [Blattella germanica]|nr:hypothetical protein C0J52_15942 [Blattella germanica]
MSTIDFDEVLQHVGERGRYQQIMYYLLCIPATIPAAFLAFSQKALAIPYTVRPDGRRQYSRCYMYDVNFTALLQLHDQPIPDTQWNVTKCLYGWNYDRRDYDSTLVTDLNLVCDDGWWPSTSTTFFYVGSLFGNVVFGWIADKWGRRTSFFIILFLEVNLSILTAFSPNYVIYTILRTINGLFFPAIYQIPFILALELMGPRYRTFAGMVICMFFAMGLSLLALLGYLLRNWYTLSLATSVPFVLLFSYYWIIPESPRWLLSKNRIDEAEEIVQTMARINGKQLENKEKAWRSKVVQPVPPTSATPMDILRHPNIRKKFFILAFDWVANAVVYNGLSYNATNLGVSDYLAFFIGGAVEIPSYIITWYTMDRWGRRWVLCLTMLLGGMACVSCMFVPEDEEIIESVTAQQNDSELDDDMDIAEDEVPQLKPTPSAVQALDALAAFRCYIQGQSKLSHLCFPFTDAVWITVALAMIGKFGIAASFAVFYVFVGELLPTVLRSQAMGIASFIAGIGLLAFPYIVYLVKLGLRTLLALHIHYPLSSYHFSSGPVNPSPEEKYHATKTLQNGMTESSAEPAPESLHILSSNVEIT